MRLNDPFHYSPHPLCVEAAGEVCRHLSDGPLRDEVEEGKMLGVLVCRSPEGQLGFLAAYSGQLGGREDWPWFVPAVFDYLDEDGHFKREEAEISAINARIASMEGSPHYIIQREALAKLEKDAEADIEDYRRQMSEAKARRDLLRNGKSGETVDDAALIRESQYQKAELRRLKARWQERIAEARRLVAPHEDAINKLKAERHQRSDTLQRWLFDHFVMLNAQGERRTLTDIFANTPQRVPPSGAGECCAPKLLQYAFIHHLQPLAIAEFWQGRSPRMEVRHHGQFYPACRGKCLPILQWMLKGMDLDSTSTAQTDWHGRLRVVYSDSSLIVVDKPSGLLSVPGLTGEESVESILRRDYPQVFMVHRLDQDTSGLLVVTLTAEAYHDLQRQFLSRKVYKRYVALLEYPEGLMGPMGHIGPIRLIRPMRPIDPMETIAYPPLSGTISLPLRPDHNDRPRQVVDTIHGKEAVTDYEMLEITLSPDGKPCVRVSLTPHTGRTHQLRLHCAHTDGLGMPIVGDRLYGQSAERLCLHAAELHFTHPATGERMAFTSEPPF